MVPGPLLEGRETRSPDCIPVTRLVLFQQPVAYQSSTPPAPISTGAVRTMPLERRSRGRPARGVDAAPVAI